jgi:hypothetical protein
MHDENPENEHNGDEEDDWELPLFSITELTNKNNTGGSVHEHTILIEERTIADLARIVAFANKELRPIVFEQCVLSEARVIGISVDISFDDCRFTEEVRFDGVVSTGRLSFFDTHFDEEAQFQKTVFKEGVVFDECVFANRVSFFQAVLEKRAVFTLCEFEEDVIFDEVKAAADVDFSDSTFGGNVSFCGARFEKQVNLSNIEFERPPDTTGSNIEEAEKAARGEHRPAAPQEPEPTIRKEKAQFNPWRELDKASKKSMTRRHLLRGLFRFLPDDDKE